MQVTSHNYYFIKELLPLEGVLWHCCGEAGTAPEEGWGMRVWGHWGWGGGVTEEEGGAVGGEETCFNLGHLPVCTRSGDRASPATNLKKHMLCWVSTWINWPNYSWYKTEGGVQDRHFYFLICLKWCGMCVPHTYIERDGGYLSRWQHRP